MFGSGEVFDYFRCSHCGCLQITTLPTDLSPYYPSDYYAHQGRPAQGLRGLLRRWRNRGLLHSNPLQHLLGQILKQFQPYPSLQALAHMVQQLKVSLPRSARILDLGCGQGQLAHALAELGFQQVWGVDPFLPLALEAESKALSSPPQLRRQKPEDLQGQWDLIMLHHSLEHLSDPHTVFAQLYQSLAPHGWLLLRVPTVDSWAYEHYGSHWVQWDAPRHLYLFARENLSYLAQTHGFRLQALWDDSDAFQFWGSEAYLQGQTLAQAQSQHKLWSAKRQQLQAQTLNRQGRGDQVVCLLHKQPRNT